MYKNPRLCNFNQLQRGVVLKCIYTFQVGTSALLGANGRYWYGVPVDDYKTSYFEVDTLGPPYTWGTNVITLEPLDSLLTYYDYIRTVGVKLEFTPSQPFAWGSTSGIADILAHKPWVSLTTDTQQGYTNVTDAASAMTMAGAHQVDMRRKWKRYYKIKPSANTQTDVNGTPFGRCGKTFPVSQDATSFNTMKFGVVNLFQPETVTESSADNEDVNLGQMTVIKYIKLTHMNSIMGV